MKRTALKRGTKQMKRGTFRKVGKVGRANLKANQQLAKILPKEYCEIRLPDCMVTWPLQFVHRHKRAWYRGKTELLSDIKHVVIGCQECHEKIEHDAELTEKVFNKLRGEEQ